MIRGSQQCQNPPSSREPRGFTLIELLVVIAIIAVLVALLLPAVQQCREAARRSMCKANLGQIALALHNYDMAFSTLPPGTVNAAGPIVNQPSKDEYHVSWTVQILAFLELSSVSNHFDFNEGVYEPQNLAPQQRSITVFLCPSNPPVQLEDGRMPTNYAGVHSGVARPIDVDQDGVLFLNSSVGYEDIPDGASYTIAVSEKVAGFDDVWGWASGTRDTLRNSGLLANGDPAPMPHSQGGLGTAAGAIPASAVVGGSNTDDAEPTDPLLLVGTFSSSHAGGAQYAFADGSVRFLSGSANRFTFQNLCSRNDGTMPDLF